jgi:hypothetical protein
MTTYAPSIPLHRPRLAGAELLKLRKRRGLAVTTGLLTIGAMAITSTILIALHAANPAKHGPAGGVANLGHFVGLLSLLVPVAAILVGATAGAGDLGSGVFKELVVTGRSRLALFAARIPGGLAFLFSFVVAAYGIGLVTSFAFAGSLGTPSAGTAALALVWLLGVAAFFFTVALGMASLLGSRTTTIAVLLPFQLALSPILVGISILGWSREAFPLAAMQQLLPHPLAAGASVIKGSVAMSSTTSVLVLVAWSALALAVGAWRTTTRDA